MILDGILDRCRNGFEVGFDSGLSVEVENWPKQVLQLLRRQVRDIVIEYQVHVRAAGICVGIAGSHRSGATHASDLDALIPFLFLHRTTVDLEMNTVVLDLDIADSRLVAGLSCRAPHSDHLLQLFSARGKLAIFQGQSLFPHRKRGPDVYQFGVECAHQINARLLGDVRQGRGWFLVVRTSHSHDEQKDKQNRNLTWLHGTPRGPLNYSDYSAVTDGNNTQDVGVPHIAECAKVFRDRQISAGG